MSMGTEPFHQLREGLAPMVISAFFELLHFVSLGLQDCTQSADPCCLVDSLLPHPTVWQGNALRFQFVAFYVGGLPRSCLSSDPTLFKTPSGFM